MNKDLIFVTAHCPTREQTDRLDECINSLPTDEFDIALVSHTHIPLSIQQKCQYYIFDQFNELSDDLDLKHFEYHSGKNHSLKTKWLKKTPFYGFAIYRMFSIISKLAKNYNYERIYHVEYDYVIKDVSIFKNHKIFLEKFDSIFYTIKEDNDMILGGLKSFKVDKLPYFFSNYDRVGMTNMMKSNNLIPLEQFTKFIFLNSGNPLFIDNSFLNDKVEIKKFESQEQNWCWCYNQSNNFLYLFYLNMMSTSQEIISVKSNLFTSKEHIIDIKNFTLISLGDLDNISELELYRNKTIVSTQTIKEDFRENIKKYSTIDIF